MTRPTPTISPAVFSLAPDGVHGVAGPQGPLDEQEPLHRQRDDDPRAAVVTDAVQRQEEVGTVEDAEVALGGPSLVMKPEAAGAR